MPRCPPRCWNASVPFPTTARPPWSASSTGWGLSARAYTRIIKIARTIADLAGQPDILPAHLAEAAGYRFLDRRNILDL